MSTSFFKKFQKICQYFFVRRFSPLSLRYLYTKRPYPQVDKVFSATYYYSITGVTTIVTATNAPLL